MNKSAFRKKKAVYFYLIIFSLRFLNITNKIELVLSGFVVTPKIKKIETMKCHYRVMLPRAKFAS